MTKASHDKDMELDRLQMKIILQAFDILKLREEERKRKQELKDARNNSPK